MFEEVFGMASACTEEFRDGVRDPFGASIIAETLEPILKEIDSLRHLNADIERQAHNVDLRIQEAQAIPFGTLKAP